MERLTRVRQRDPRDAVRDALYDIVRRGRARPTLDDRKAKDILGHGLDGLPT